jgi:UDP-glucose 4-epimerase
LVIFAINNGKNGEILVQKSPATTIGILIKAIKKLMNSSKHPVIKIGVRHGEKLYESLLNNAEFTKSIEKKKYFIVPPDFRDLNYSEFFEIGKKKIFHEDYNSSNTKRLSLNETIKTLKKLDNLITYK